MIIDIIFIVLGTIVLSVFLEHLPMNNEVNERALKRAQRMHSENMRRRII